MTGYKYSRTVDNTCSKAVGKALPVSLKTSVEVCRHIRGRTLARAKTILENVMKKKEAVPLVRYFQEVAHKPGMSVGKYPVKSAHHILEIVKSAEKNAQEKGLNTGSLMLYHAAAQKAHTSHHYGRHGRRAKRTHIEIILKEDPKKKVAKKTVKKSAKPKAKPAEKKVEAKPKAEVKKAEAKKPEAKPAPAAKPAAPQQRTETPKVTQ